MKYQWRNNPRGEGHLILFFCGWGTTPDVVGHLQSGTPADVLSLYDYSQCDPEDIPPIDHYDAVDIVAWSMGVWAAEKCHEVLRQAGKAVAVNGTPLPMNDDYGIPIKVFEGTLEGLNDANRERFDRRMCGGASLRKVYHSFRRRSTEDLRSELQHVYESVRDLPFTPPHLPWTRAIISSRDLIIPPTNQVRYWEEAGVPHTILERIGHYPFMEYDRWSEIL